jgi:hypothetical protein
MNYLRNIFSASPPETDCQVAKMPRKASGGKGFSLGNQVGNVLAAHTYCQEVAEVVAKPKSQWWQRFQAYLGNMATIFGRYPRVINARKKGVENADF